MARKKKTKQKKELEKFGELEVGQEVWCKLWNEDIAYGKIYAFFPKNKEGPAMRIYDELSHSYRVALVSTIHVPKEKNKRKLKRLKSISR